MTETAVTDVLLQVIKERDRLKAVNARLLAACKKLLACAGSGPFALVGLDAAEIKVVREIEAAVIAAEGR